MLCWNSPPRSAGSPAPPEPPREAWMRAALREAEKGAVAGEGPVGAGAAVVARVAEIVYGASDPKTGAVSTLYRIASDTRLNHRAIVTSGVLAEECSALLTSFFRSRRAGLRGV